MFSPHHIDGNEILQNLLLKFHIIKCAVIVGCAYLRV